jgi:hypothetical protein
MSTSTPLHLFLFTFATSGLISILSIAPSAAINPVSSSPTPAYLPPARETPLRTESAGVRLGEEKGPATVTQNTIATERLIIYRPVIAPILDWLQDLILRTQKQSHNRPQKQPR